MPVKFEYEEGGLEPLFIGKISRGAELLLWVAIFGIPVALIVFPAISTSIRAHYLLFVALLPLGTLASSKVARLGRWRVPAGFMLGLYLIADLWLLVFVISRYIKS